MYDHRVKRLPVTDKTGRLVGIVSRTDVLSVFTRDDYEASRLLDAIRHVEAVVGVRDRISYPHEKQTGMTQLRPIR
jgi:CBS domain-containing protein